jgi:23S rRNA (uracil1939-C5)-methyltransferase
MRKKKTVVPHHISATMTSLATGGACVGTITQPEELAGKKAFIHGTAPGETVTAEVTFSKKSFVNARLLTVVESSPERITPRCPVASECGGCDLQHINLPAQRSLKLSMVEDLLRIHGGVTAKEGVSLLGADLPGFDYRRRMSFHLNREGAFGLYRKLARSIVEIESCPIATATINQFLQDNITLVKACAPEIETVTVEDHDGEVHLALEVHPRNESAMSTLSVKPEFKELCARFQNLQVNYRHKPIFRVVERAEGAPPVGHFSQNNRAANDLMLEYIISNVPTDAVTDLYAGAGNISIPLALAGKTVTAVELDPHLVEFGTYRAAQSGVGDRLKFFSMGCEKWIEQHAPETSIVLDPPRSGALEVCQRLDASKSPWVLYVSCYPPTFARDVQVLVERGYELILVKVLDMFPQTYHSELIGILRPKTSPL